MNLVWLSVNASYSHRSLALPLLERSSAAVSDVHWASVQTTIKDSPGATAHAVVQKHPSVVAATLYLFNRRFALDVLGRVKSLLPTCGILVGGPECLGDNTSLLRDTPWLDGAVRGEAEGVFPRVLQRLASGKSPTGLPGVCWRDADGQVYEEMSCPVYMDWASAPPPSSSPFFRFDAPFVQLETSRGCANRCSYCTSACSTPVRIRTIDGIRTELLEFRRRDVREVRILDRTFNASPERASDLLRLFRKEFPDICFHLEIHPAMLSKALRVELLKTPPGNLHIEAGLQTTAKAALAAVRRHGDADEALDGIRFLVSCNALFHTHVDLLAGLPRQSLEDLHGDLQELVTIGPDEIQLELLKVLPGTDLHQNAKALGVAYSPVPPYEVLRTQDMSPDELHAAQALSRTVDLFYNEPSLRPAVRIICSQDSEWLRRWSTECATHGWLFDPISLKRRFTLLHEKVLSDCPQAADELKIQWMKRGFSPEHGICRATLWKKPLPASALPLSPHTVPSSFPNHRIWQLVLTRGTWWFVYDRTRQTRGPVAIYRMLHA